MGVLSSISSYNKGPVQGYKILLHSSSADDLDRFWDFLMYIQMETGVFYYDRNRSFTDYLCQNYMANYVYYDWENKTATIKYAGDDKLEVGCKIKMIDKGSTLEIDFEPIWYQLNRKKKMVRV